MAIHEPRQHTGFRHVLRMTDDRGIIEHALGSHPRFHTGYCSDDNARLLVVSVRDQTDSDDALRLSRVGARFLFDALREDGQIHNRLSFERVWLDTATTDDCWGRAVWAFGEAVKHAKDIEVRNRCYDAFQISSVARSESIRSMSFAAIGAALVLEVDERNPDARDLLHDVRTMFAFHPNGLGSWQWLEPRLTYANALLPEAMIACGTALQDDALISRGLHLLRWLVDTETLDDHLSVTPVGGRGPGERGPKFDQQPIEVAALADAAVRAGEVTGTSEWDDVVYMATSWFLGNNDVGASMIDLETGGGYDGLEQTGVNLNQGAESTLAMISTMQHRSATWLV